MNRIFNFQIDDIDGCEYVKCIDVGLVLISWDRDEDGYETGNVRVIYADGSGTGMEPEKAQANIDSGKWAVYRIGEENSYSLQRENIQLRKKLRAVEQLLEQYRGDGGYQTGY